MNNFEEREKFRIKIWEDLNIVFPKMAFRQVVGLLGEEQTRAMFDLLQSKDFSYLAFVISPELPPDMEPKYRELFENPNFMIAVNVLRIAKIETYVSDNISVELRDFLEILLHYLHEIEKCFRMNLSDKVSNCVVGEIRKSKEQFRRAENTFMKNVKYLPFNEKYVCCCIGALCLEELSGRSFLKLEEIFGAQRSTLVAIGELQN